MTSRPPLSRQQQTSSSTSASSLPTTNITAGSWASHLRQLIDNVVIKPHVIAAGDVLGARAIPCAMGPLLGVAWGIADTPRFYRESAVAILQEVRSSNGVGPARYAAWCLLDCCARVVREQQQQQSSNSNNNKNTIINKNNSNNSNIFLDELERNLPALVATHMPLSGVADPTVIDVDDDSLDTIRAKARLERKCFRRLYLEILNGWIRDPWWSSNAINNTSLPRQLVEHVVLALCGTKKNAALRNAIQQQHQDHLNNDFAGGNNGQSSSSNNNSNNQQQNNNLNMMLAPEYFVKQEPGMRSGGAAADSSSNNSSQQQQQLAHVKAEAGLAALSSDTLSKVMNLVMMSASTSKSNNNNKKSTTSTTKNNNNKPEDKFSRLFQSSSSNINNSNNNTSADILTETRKNVAKLVKDLNSNSDENIILSKMFKCGHCGTLFPKEAARNAHAMTHFSALSVADQRQQQQTGERINLHRLPPPTPNEFINYLGDAESGEPPIMYVNDSEQQELQRLKTAVAAAAASSSTSSSANPALNRNASSASSAAASALSNHPLMKRFQQQQNRSTATNQQQSSSRKNTTNFRNNNNNAAIMDDTSSLVFVSDPLVKRSCFKCAKVFEPRQHPVQGWYLEECVEHYNPQDGQMGYAHKKCVM